MVKVASSESLHYEQNGVRRKSVFSKKTLRRGNTVRSSTNPRSLFRFFRRHLVINPNNVIKFLMNSPSFIPIYETWIEQFKSSQPVAEVVNPNSEKIMDFIRLANNSDYTPNEERMVA